MSFQITIEELINKSSVLQMEHIAWWLIKHENYFKYSISESSCRKWSKWLNKGEKPFPCVCPLREQDCVFIELYYELDKISQLHKEENNYHSLISNYSQIKNSPDLVLKWVLDNKNDKSKFLTLDNSGNILIKVTITKEPYDYLEICIDKESFISLLQFKREFRNLSYSGEY